MSKLASSQVTSRTPGTLRKGTASIKSKSAPGSALSQQNSPASAGVLALRRLFDELGERFKDRPEGFTTRIIKLGRRHGDNSEVAIIELVDKTREGKVNKSASKRAKSAKASKKQTAKGSKSKASSIVRAGQSSSKPSTKSAAGSTLTQLRNPRSGRFVKVDKTVGTIIAHKKSSGAYKGVPVAGTISSRR